MRDCRLTKSHSTCSTGTTVNCVKLMGTINFAALKCLSSGETYNCYNIISRVDKKGKRISNSSIPVCKSFFCNTKYTCMCPVQKYV